MIKEERRSGEIDSCIKSILINDFLVREEVLDDNEQLFGEVINLDPRDMVYLIYLLETKFDIRFSKQDIDNLDIFTLSGLRKILIQKMQKDDCRHLFT